MADWGEVPESAEGAARQPVRPVVVGVDGSPSSEEALRWAADAAAQRSLPLVIVSAARPKPAVVSEAGLGAARLLDRAETEARRGRPDLVTSTRFVGETSSNALIEASETASLVVVGSRGHGGFHDLMLGSTSLHTAMHAQCPVAVIRPTQLATAASEQSAGRILVGVDGSPRSQPALHFAFDHAERTGLGVTALHAWQGAITTDPIAITYGPGTDEQQRQAEQELADAVAPWLRRYPQVDVRRVTVEMSPADALVRQSMGANLVVVGSRGLGGFAALVLGSAGHALIHHSGCPVVITHPSPALSFGEEPDTP